MEEGTAEVATSVRAPVSEGQVPEQPEGAVTRAEGEGTTGGQVSEETTREGEPGGRSDQRDRTEHGGTDRGEPTGTTTGGQGDRDQGVVRESVLLNPEH